MKLAIAISSDPKSGDDGLGRAFQGLALAAEAQQHGDQVDVVFIGPGTRWPAVASKLGHPLHDLYHAVRTAVKGASCGCADVFGATAGVEACGVPKLKDFNLAGTSGLASLRRYLAEGWQTLVF
ncbi:MAG: DsrE family protein [Planctomycetes bacterium]|nr:DsrE family protein [Planctomycetota bacterium]